jgi:hypothetical protein
MVAAVSRPPDPRARPGARSRARLDLLHSRLIEDIIGEPDKPFGRSFETGALCLLGESDKAIGQGQFRHWLLRGLDGADPIDMQHDCLSETIGRERKSAMISPTKKLTISHPIGEPLQGEKAQL